MENRKNQSAIALAIAQVVLWGFNKHYSLFRECSAGAQERFERADWPAVQKAARDRIAFYDQRVLETVDKLEREFATDKLPDEAWLQVKTHYINLLVDHKQPELAETFFNSVCCKILHRTYFSNEYIFVRPTISTEHIDSDPPAYRSYYPGTEGMVQVLRRIFEDFGLKTPFVDLDRDIRLVIKASTLHIEQPFRAEPNHQIQILSALFFRNKGAYVIGKVINGHRQLPFAIPVLHDSSGKLFLDTVLYDVNDILSLFSFARAYFMVDMEVPAAYVQFLRSMLPSKPKAELYTMLGLQKHGKALFYRDFLHHLRHSSDPFTIAPGIKGLVMLVFTLSSFPYVFKIIKDVIARPKEVDREGVKAKYLMVKVHDRAGRMADTLEYSDVAFPKSRFSQELLDEIRKFAPSLLIDEGDNYIVRHLYIERRMIPLNIYLANANEQQARRALNEYGLAIKQLAAANIFAGDMLYKNFGVTRQGRVVFYDYDEIEYMTACNFRRIPEPRNEEDEMASEPWYNVARNDVFPEEWKTFLLGDPKIRATMLELHPDLFEAEYWAKLKKRIESGHVEDFYPYANELRFHQGSESELV